MKTVETQRKTNGRPRMESPSPIDVHVGSKVKQRRLMIGLSQEKLGKKIGLTFQQVQKYERGTNRIGASRLYELSCILNVPINFFFEDIDFPAPQSGARGGLQEDRQELLSPPDPLAKRETLELARAYYRISDPHVRRRVFDLIKAIANASFPDTDKNSD